MSVDVFPQFIVHVAALVIHCIGTAPAHLPAHNQVQVAVGTPVLRVGNQYSLREIGFHGQIVSLDAENPRRLVRHRQAERIIGSCRLGNLGAAIHVRIDDPGNRYTVIHQFPFKGKPAVGHTVAIHQGVHFQSIHLLHPQLVSATQIYHNRIDVPNVRIAVVLEAGG